MKFNTLEIIEPILKAVKEQGYTDATPIQEKAIPHALKGRDILGCAQTGTGKTAAFSIPTIQHLQKRGKSHNIRALILTPTRELAIQIQENVSAYAKYTNIKSTVIFGGVPQKPQERAIRAGIDIMIATPGRLNDLVKQKIVNLSHIEIFILDEADRMLDMGFLNDVKKIITKIPAQKQTLFFSATMPKEIRSLVHTLLHDPITVEVTPASTTVDRIDQTLYYVDKANKKLLLLDLLKKYDVQNALVFTRTKSNANRLTKFLQSCDISTGVIHGNKSQTARQLALSQFKDGKLRVLVATDIAARGIDVNELSHVFNYDIPNEAEAYVHRIGRTGRAGKEGTSISFADIDEVDYVRSIQKLIRGDIPVNREHDYPMMVTTPSPKKKQGKPAKKVDKASKAGKANKTVSSNTTKPKDKASESKSKRFNSDTKKGFDKKRSGDSKPFRSKNNTNQKRKPQHAMRGN